ncbi:MAG: SLC13 family permease [Candidatus Thorarchaeota archaeon]
MDARIAHSLTGNIVLVLATAALVISSVILERTPVYSLLDVQVLVILLVFLVIVRGLETHGVVHVVAGIVQSHQHRAPMMVVATAFLSMIITNDVALLAVVPLTLQLDLPKKRELVVYETIAANAGSVLMPFGNPQNLLIFYFYGLSLPAMFLSTAPLAVVVLVLVTAWSARISDGDAVQHEVGAAIDRYGKIYAALFVLFCLAVVHILPLWVGLVPLCYAAIFDRGSFRIDYSLLLTFVAFFGFTDNMMQVFSPRLNCSFDVFVSAVLLSQVISNVSATLLLVDFTSDWAGLLWGVSVGGLGGLFGSMASLISYQIYSRTESDTRAYLKQFHLYSMIALLVGVAAFVVFVGLRPFSS